MVTQLFSVCVFCWQYISQIYKEHKGLRAYPYIRNRDNQIYRQTRLSSDQAEFTDSLGQYHDLIHRFHPRQSRSSSRNIVILWITPVYYSATSMILSANRVMCDSSLQRQLCNNEKDQNGWQYLSQLQSCKRKCILLICVRSMYPNSRPLKGQ